MKITVFWDVAQCCLAERYQRLEEPAGPIYIVVD